MHFYLSIESKVEIFLSFSTKKSVQNSVNLELDDWPLHMNVMKWELHDAECYACVNIALGHKAWVTYAFLP